MGNVCELEVVDEVADEVLRRADMIGDRLIECGKGVHDKLAFGIVMTNEAIEDRGILLGELERIVSIIEKVLDHEKDVV